MPHQNPAGTCRTYDVFLSYVVEDRKIVELLHDALCARGLRVWYARDRLIPGTPVRDVIEEGLSISRFGVSIISPRYQGHWAHGELFAMMQRKFIPVLYDMSIEDLIRKDPEMIILYCLDIRSGIDHVADKIVDRVKIMPRIYYFCGNLMNTVERHFTKLLLLILVLASSLLLLSTYDSMKPCDALMQSGIREHIASIQNKVQNDLKQDMIQYNSTLSDINQVYMLQKSMFSTFSPKSHRNSFVFSNGSERISSISGLVASGVLKFESETEPPFGLTGFRVYIFSSENKIPAKQVKYTLLNLMPVDFKILSTDIRDGLFEVYIQYTNPLRYAEVALDFTRKGQVLRQVRMLGLKSRERLVFEKKGSGWILAAVR